MVPLSLAMLRPSLLLRMASVMSFRNEARDIRDQEEGREEGKGKGSDTDNKLLEMRLIH